MLQVWRAADRYRGGDTAAGIDTRHAFSFSGFYDPDNVGFGQLVACNEERLAPGAGFPEHPHRDVEIVTWVVEGELEHLDSTGRVLTCARRGRAAAWARAAACGTSNATRARAAAFRADVAGPGHRRRGGPRKRRPGVRGGARHRGRHALRRTAHGGGAACAAARRRASAPPCRMPRGCTCTWCAGPRVGSGSPAMEPAPRRNARSRRRRPYHRRQGAGGARRGRPGGAADVGDARGAGLRLTGVRRCGAGGAAVTRPRSSASTASVNGGQASIAHGPKSRSASATQAAPASGSTQRNVPDCPKCPKVRGEDEVARPVRGLAVPDLEAEAPVVGRLVAVARQHALQPGEGHRRSPPSSVAGTAAGATAVRPRSGPGRRRWRRRPWRGSPAAPSPSCPAARAPPRAGTAGRGSRWPWRGGRRAPRTRRWSRCRRVPGAAIAPVLVEGQPGGVGEEVADRRTVGPGGLVQLDGALLDRDQRRVGGERLGDGGEREPLPGGAVAAGTTAPSGRTAARDDDGRSGRHGPVLDHPQAVHGPERNAGARIGPNFALAWSALQVRSVHL